MTAYYNEHDPFAAAWLRNLIAAGLIAPGDVDERSIEDVRPHEIEGYTQAHFFAGIGGWSYALRLAGWPDDRPVWTGSCPCQPFSVAGARKGFNDSRHLWPEWFRLIRQCRPPVVFGEQVASAAAWLNRVRCDLEAVEYAVGCMPIEAASAGADHFRDRYWIVADTHYTVRRAEKPTGDNPFRPAARWHEGNGNNSKRGSRRLVNPAGLGWGEGWTKHELRRGGFTAAVASIGDGQFVECPDGKWRRLPPPRVRWLGIGVPSRVAKLRAFGNAIDARPAAEFIGAYMDISKLPARKSLDCGLDNRAE